MSSVQPIINFSVQIEIFKASFLSFTLWSRAAIHLSLMPLIMHNLKDQYQLN